MKIAAGIAGILLGIFSLTYVGIFGSMIGSAAGLLGSIPFRGNTLGPWAEMVSMLSWLAPLATIVGGIVTFSNPRVGGIILGASAFAHWYLLGFGVVGKLFVLPIGATAGLALFANSSTRSATNLGTAQTSAEPPNLSGSTAGPSFDRAKWNALVQYDKDIAFMAEKLRPLGQKWMDEFASSYLALNDKTYLPEIERKIVASAKLETEENERQRVYLEEQQKLSLQEQERLAQERNEQKERRAEARRKQFELWRDRLWRYKAVVGVILLSLVVGGGYWYYQKQETEKIIAAEKQRVAEVRAKVEAQYYERLSEAQRRGTGKFAGIFVLRGAIYDDRTDIAEFAIDKGANVNDGSDDQDGPPIFTAHSVKMLELLFAKGASLTSIRGGNGGNLLHEAVRSTPRPAIVELLLAKGVSVIAKDLHGKTPLALARDWRKVDEYAIAEARAKKESDSLQRAEQNLKNTDTVIGLLLKSGAEN